MRKIHQQTIRKMADTLLEACGELENCSGKTFVGLCGQMQEFAAAFYDCVQEYAGEDHPLTDLLETFYRLLYCAVQGEAETGALGILAEKIRDEAQSIEPDRIEVVFLCHKASMSDALESVYMAAKADAACDAYFIPIPYYDRAPDGSFQAEHLEGLGYYPDTYELMDWRAYDIAERRPEVIFTINCYDEQNRVTSVHPDFYCKRLRELTDLLVYIEYGIPYWAYRDPTAAIEEIRRQGKLFPGQIYPHYCIAYSKELADTLQVVFQTRPDIAQKYGVPWEEFQQKYIALGSPKFDKVLCAKKEDFALPANWKHIIADRKTVLFNTSLGTLLKDTRTYLPKLRETLAVFRERKEIVLWWRPHPLSMTTLEAMEPELVEEYRVIVDGYRREGWGVYDDSPDLHRAIAHSDAYYGDESSLIYLYCATGKPMTICSFHHQNEYLTAGTDTFHRALEWRNENMRTKGGNPTDSNVCMGWWTFCDDLSGLKYLSLFLDFVAYPEKYPAGAVHRELQLRLFRDFVVNPDGTAGQKIYEFAKEKALAGEEHEK